MITLQQLSNALDLKQVTTLPIDDIEVSGGYCSDLLSDVMGNAREGQAWITIQVHQNIIAVAALKELAAIIVANDIEPLPDTILLANVKQIPIFKSTLSAFEIAGKMYAIMC